MTPLIAIRKLSFVHLLLMIFNAFRTESEPASYLEVAERAEIWRSLIIQNTVSFMSCYTDIKILNFLNNKMYYVHYVHKAYSISIYL